MAVRRIGFLGLGAMGSGMAARLVESGFEVTVYNRTRAKSERLGELGAKVADTPAQAADGADLVVLSLAEAAVVEKVLFGSGSVGDAVLGSDGALATLPKGALVADASTVPPGFAQELDVRVTRAGFRFLDARILGNAEHARDGELRFMVGGPEADLETARPAFSALAKEITHLGPVGAGATMKLVLNLLMGIEMQALAEAVVFGERAGLPREAVIKAIAASGFSSPVMKFKCGVMARRDFEQPDFRLSLMRKDLGLVLDECRRLQVPMPASAASWSALSGAVEQGLGDLDCAAILQYVEDSATSG